MENNDIKDSWEKNAPEWIKAIESETIESRKFTNKAIIEAALNNKPKHILDLGCGEGWLTRELSKFGINCTGIDASNPLIENARKKGDQNFLNLSYEELIEKPESAGKAFDAIIINFSLFLKDETRHLLESLKSILSEDGCILIQTLHPVFLIKSSMSYQSQWIQDSWAGLKGDFKDPHQWYIRTFEDWIKVFKTCGLTLKSLKEPVNNDKEPLSVIFELMRVKS